MNTRLAHAAAACIGIFVSFSAAAHTFTDALNRTVSVENPQNVAVLQGSLAAVWIRAGGTVACATSDAFSEPPAMSEEQARALNEQWHTACFSAHGVGVVRAGETESVGTMFSPNGERLLALGVDFVILSAHIAGHQRLLPLLERAGIAAAFFSLDTFDDYLRMLRVCTEITGKSDLYRKNGTDIQARCAAIVAAAREQAARAPTVLLLRAFSGGVRAKNSGNNMTGAMLHELGARNIADSDRAFGEEVSLEAIIAADPDIILVTTMGASEEKAVAGFERQLAASPVWRDLSAVKGGRCHLLPRELFHFKPDGEKWVDCYALLSAVLYQIKQEEKTMNTVLSLTAIILVSFGTSYEDNRQATIVAVEQEVRRAFPEASVTAAYTSSMIRKKLLERDGTKIFSVSEAMEDAKAKGCKTVIVQPTHLMYGLEYNEMKSLAAPYEAQFDEIRYGAPLLATNEDISAVLAAVARDNPLAKRHALVLMGHGTAYFSNFLYAAMDYQAKQEGYGNMFVGTVEAYPTCADVIALVKAGRYKGVLLAPLMLAAGDHANNDMAGDDDDSWKRQFERAGFTVAVNVKGLGEYPAIRAQYMRHVSDALGIPPRPIPVTDPK